MPFETARGWLDLWPRGLAVPSEPLIALADRIQHSLHAARYAKLVEDAKEVVLDRVLAQLQRRGQLAIAQAIRQQVQNLLLALAEQGSAEKRS